MKKMFALPIFLIGVLSLCQAQTYGIGDDVRDVPLNFIEPMPGASKIKDLKGKLIILDFWGTLCKGCIKALPKMDSLQQQFKDKLQIILVTKDSRQKVQQFFAARKSLNGKALPQITDDTLLSKYFPHQGLPFHVWIDESGKVLAKSSGSYTNKTNVQRYFAGGLRLKESVIRPPYNRNEVYIFKDTSIIRQLTSFSFLMPAVDSLNFSEVFKRRKDKKIYRLTANHMSLLSLLVMAYNEDGKYHFNGFQNNVVLEVKNPAQYKHPRDIPFEEWNAAYGVLYDIKIPESKADSFFKIMQADLLRSLDIEVKIEKRKIKCLTLIRTTNEDRLATKGGAKIKELRKPPYETLWRFRNQPFAVFSKSIERNLANGNHEYVFRDLTGYIGNVDIDIDAEFTEFTNIEKMRNDLKPYGLDLVHQELEAEVLVIREVNTGN